MTMWTITTPLERFGVKDKVSPMELEKEQDFSRKCWMMAEFLNATVPSIFDE